MPVQSWTFQSLFIIAVKGKSDAGISKFYLDIFSRQKFRMLIRHMNVPNKNNCCFLIEFFKSQVYWIQILLFLLS